MTLSFTHLEIYYYVNIPIFPFSILFYKIVNPCSCPNIKDQVSHPYVSNLYKFFILHSDSYETNRTSMRQIRAVLTQPILATFRSKYLPPSTIITESYITIWEREAECRIWWQYLDEIPHIRKTFYIFASYSEPLNRNWSLKVLTTVVTHTVTFWFMTLCSLVSGVNNPGDILSQSSILDWILRHYFSLQCWQSLPECTVSQAGSPQYLQVCFITGPG
jgi:hypothetical protein